jgi:hypothetical protein
VNEYDIQAIEILQSNGWPGMTAVAAHDVLGRDAVNFKRLSFPFAELIERAFNEKAS